MTINYSLTFKSFSTQKEIVPYLPVWAPNNIQSILLCGIISTSSISFPVLHRFGHAVLLCFYQKALSSICRKTKAVCQLKLNILLGPFDNGAEVIPTDVSILSFHSHFSPSSFGDSCLTNRMPKRSHGFARNFTCNMAKPLLRHLILFWWKLHPLLCPFVTL